MRWGLGGAVLVLSLASLLIPAGNTGIASGYIDPLSRIGAQDEALYSHSAIRMARQGDWLTPRFLGRFGLYKPPLLMWASAATVRLLGLSDLALRLPVVLAATLAGWLVFAWLARMRSAAAGLAGALLLVSNHLWHVLGSMCMTDALLAAWIVAALFSIHLDPRLERPRTFYAFALSTAGALLTKSIAGLFPLLVLVLFWLCWDRALLRKLLRLAGWIALIAAPWYLYHLAVHTRWFWAEHVNLEIMSFGLASPPQTSREDQLLFYLRRLFSTDPVLSLAALAALAWFVRALRRERRPSDLLLACWLLLGAAVMLVWSYRNAAYLTILLPALAILAAGYGPLLAPRRPYAVALLALVFVAKAISVNPIWGLSFQRGTTITSAPLLASYCQKGRPNELILIAPDDSFYASVLPLPRVRYCFLSAAAPPDRYRLDFAYLGISVNAEQFAHLDQWQPVFTRRLSEWNLHSTEPVASVIFAASQRDVIRTVLSHPQSDFFLPESFRSILEPLIAGTHDLVEVSPDKIFLLSRAASGTRPNPPDAEACAL